MDEKDTLTKAVELGESWVKDRQAEKNKKVEESKTEDQKKAEAEARAKQEAEEKTKAEEAVKQIEADEALLEKPEDQLTDPEKERRKQLVDDFEKAQSELPDAVKKSMKKNLKRIDKLTERLREEEAANESLKAGYEELQQKLRAMETVVEEIKKPVEEKKVVQKLSQAEKERIAKYLSEDAEVAREERREMANEELQEWFAEDPISAQEWIAKRETRRAEERKQDAVKTTEKEVAEKFIAKQEESIQRLIKSRPGVLPEKDGQALLAEGKTKEEVHKILSEKYPEYKFVDDFVKAHPDVYKQENAGDIILGELQKWEANKKPSAKPEKRVFTEEEVQQRIKEAQEMERKRLESIDAGDTSSRGPINNIVKEKLSEEEQEIERIGQSLKWSSEQIKRAVNRHREKIKRGDFKKPGEE